MIGIVIICHRKMALAIKETAVNIIGNKDYLEAIEVFPEDGIEGSMKKLETIFNAWQKLDGILVFVDMFGGTPCNSVCKLIKQYENLDVVTGVNLPMVLSAITSMNTYKDVEEMAENIVEQNQKSVFNLRKLDIFRG